MENFILFVVVFFMVMVIIERVERGGKGIVDHYFNEKRKFINKLGDSDLDKIPLSGRMLSMKHTAN